MQIQSFTKAPFYLGPDDLIWVTQTFAELSLPQKAALVFATMQHGPEMDHDALSQVQPGFVTRMGGGSAQNQLSQLHALNARMTVPVVICADLEGSWLSLDGGTPAPNPMAFAAGADPALTRQASAAMGYEARHYGIGWSFTPAIDLNLAFRSAIVGTRSFGSELDTVRAQGRAMVLGLQEAGLAATAKHWPGEGRDSRDQHLATTINDMSMADWRATFGSLYAEMIEAGVMSIMSAHIGLPAYMTEVAGITGPDAFLPASLNRHLNEDLLRGELGFHGLIVSDATAMAGISGLRRRADLVVDTLNAGCDVILGTPDLHQDAGIVAQAVRDGRIPASRLDEAVLRQLALKAALGVQDPQTTVPKPDNDAVTKALQAAPTLVRAKDGLLPVTPDRYGKIYLVSRGVLLPPASPTQPQPLALTGMLEQAGFEVIQHDWGTPVTPEGCDLLLYVYAEETLLTRSVIHNAWAAMNGDFISAMQRHWHDIPTLMLSFGWPYHLFEAPHVHGYVNAYMSHPAMQRTVLEALMGQRDFTGRSPVDPYCGLPPAYFDM